MARKKLGLALSFGGIRGAAHIGVIKCLLDHHLPIDFVAGCSSGSLVGALYCHHDDITHAEKFFKNGKLFLASQKYLIFIEYRRKMYLLKSVFDNVNIEDLKIPFAAVASDIETGEPYIFTSGQLYRAVTASVAMPVVMPKIQYHNHSFVDGAMTIPIPTAIVREHSDVVVAVNLFNDIFPIKHFEKLGKIDDLIKSGFTSIKQLTKRDLLAADHIIAPQIRSITVNSEESLDDMIDAGYRATLPLIQRIQSSLNSSL